MLHVENLGISLTDVKLNGIICIKWPLDGSQKTFHVTVSFIACQDTIGLLSLFR